MKTELPKEFTEIFGNLIRSDKQDKCAIAYNLPNPSPCQRVKLGAMHIYCKIHQSIFINK